MKGIIFSALVFLFSFSLLEAAPIDITDWYIANATESAYFYWGAFRDSGKRERVRYRCSARFVKFSTTLLAIWVMLTCRQKILAQTA